MKPEIIEDYPPNIDTIRQYLSPPLQAIFAYGDKIYNPSKIPVYEDVVEHEKVHIKQQSQYTSPDYWYTKYLLDKDFRLDQEVEAYSRQYLFLKKIIRNKELKEALQEMAHALSHDYNLNISYNQAESRIKKYNVV